MRAVAGGRPDIGEYLVSPSALSKYGIRSSDVGVHGVSPLICSSSEYGILYNRSVSIYSSFVWCYCESIGRVYFEIVCTVDLQEKFRSDNWSVSIRCRYCGSIRIGCCRDCTSSVRSRHYAKTLTGFFGRVAFPNSSVMKNSGILERAQAISGFSVASCSARSRILIVVLRFAWI